jgi:hypothetical protein
MHLGLKIPRTEPHEAVMEQSWPIILLSLCILAVLYSLLRTSVLFALYLGYDLHLINLPHAYTAENNAVLS